MRRRPVFLIFTAVLLSFLPFTAGTQTASGWHDDLIDHMSGSWRLEGKVMGHDAHHAVHAEWTLNHQFLEIHEKTAATAPDLEQRYEANWYLGFDPISERYVVHLLDVFGGRFSETLGYGVRDGSSIKIVFEYPDGPFHTTFSWSREHDTWQWVMEQKDKKGTWTLFADLKLTRIPQ